MAIEDVIRDLNIYFDSIHKPVAIKAHMGGIVNPSYLNVTHGHENTVLTFWSVAGGSQREKELAKAFQEDIEAWLIKLESDRAGKNKEDQARRGNPPEDQDHSVKKSPGKTRTWKAGPVGNPNQGDRNPPAEDAA